MEQVQIKEFQTKFEKLNKENQRYIMAIQQALEFSQLCINVCEDEPGKSDTHKAG